MCGSLVTMSLGSLINVESSLEVALEAAAESQAAHLGGNKAIVPVFNELFYSSI